MRFIGWRWTPSVALVSGSLAFVAVAVAIVPDDLGAVGSTADRVKRASRSRLTSNAASTSEAVSPPSVDEEAVSTARERRRSGAAVEEASGAAPTGNIVQSIFHSAPKIELPVAPIDPEPQPPPPPPPPPPPTATIYTLESPPPPSPPPLAAPEAPVQPQGITGQ